MAERHPLSDHPAIAFVGDYIPRRCGIATFTSDLCEAVALQAREQCEVFAVAMNDVHEGYPYPPRVRFEVRESVLADYRLAAEFLNIQQVTAVCLQHEYGIYGGTCGSHVLAMLRRIRRPLITTLHTVLKEPSEQQRIVLQEIGRLSNRMVVMSDLAKGMLHEVYDIPGGKIVTIPHGIPDVPFVDPNYFKDKFDVEGKTVILTFGLLSPGKGLEYVVEALPAILEKHPNTVYIVVGATHPHVKRDSGEEYRNSLYRRACELGVNEHLIFQNRFVELDELLEYLGAADIYVTPYLNEAQITSGTLAYAMGTGKAVVSTPYWHAQELLDEGRGVLTGFRDADALARAVIDLLDNDTKRHAMRKRAYNYCRKMAWSRVAQDYLDLFHEASEAWVETRHAVGAPAPPFSTVQKQAELPEVNLAHLRTLTDDTGILQHALFATPDRRWGYCTDDNARGLIVAALHWETTRDETVMELMQTYLSFLAHALDEKTGRFRNFMSYDRSFSEMIGSEDSHARALWGIGAAVALCPHDALVALATRLFTEALAVTESFSSPRAMAFSIVGIHAYLRRFGGDSEVRRYRSALAERLLKLFTDNMTDDWPWLEDEVTYANGKLPHALLMSGKWMNRSDMIEVGKKSLKWLLRIQTNDADMLSIVGTEGWYTKSGKRASFDQQPIEAHALVDACIEAYHVTQEPEWAYEAYKAFNWFLGANDLRTPLHDFTTGGCRDGLHADRVNENQGAESTLAWLTSLLQMQQLQTEMTLGRLDTAIAADQDQTAPEPEAASASATPGTEVKEKRNARTDRNDQ